MNKKIMFTMVAVMVLCASGLAAVALNVSDVSDAATIDSKTGSGSESDPYTVYAYEGDALNVDLGKNASLVSGSLPNKTVLKDGKITGQLSGSASADPYSLSVAVGEETKETKYVKIYVLKSVQDSVSKNTLRGYGTSSDPWQLSVAEGKEVSFNFSFYGSTMTVSGELPDGLTQDGSKISGTLSDDSNGLHKIVLTIDGKEYYFELTVSNLLPATVSYIALAVVLIVFAAFVVMWSSRFSRSKKK